MIVDKPSTSGLTRIPGVPDSGDVIPGMAFYAGSGPADATCGQCRFKGYHHADVAKLWSYGCEKFHKLTGKHGPAIRDDYRACKYFEAAPK